MTPLNDSSKEFLKALLNPHLLAGAIFYAILFALAAVVICYLIRRSSRQLEAHMSDITVIRFVTPLLQVVVVVVLFILYARLVPELNALGTTLLAGASVLTVVIGLAAQNTLGNLVAGVSLMLYRPVNVGDTVQLTTPRGLTEAVVYDISLGFTILLNSDQTEVIVPNSLMMSTILIRTQAAGKDALAKRYPDSATGI